MENPIKSIAPLIFGRGGSRRPALRPGEIVSESRRGDTSSSSSNGKNHCTKRKSPNVFEEPMDQSFRTRSTRHPTIGRNNRTDILQDGRQPLVAARSRQTDRESSSRMPSPMPSIRTSPTNLVQVRHQALLDGKHQLDKTHT
ncbi:hypothetical protein RUM44_003987 [Polyplax serrata]|uniref:Uncharacterized protein n=1 Tax=Polyplax serrata TaxID=468196 RepID=A0ABR1B1I9_POLSC